MSDAQTQALNLRDLLRNGRWLLGNAEQLTALMGLYEELRAAPDLAGKWAVIKAMGDVIVSIVIDFPEVSSLSDDVVAQRVEDLEAEFTAAGIDWTRFREFVTTVLPLVLELILKLKG